MGKERIAAKNGLESYCFNMKTTIEDEKMADKISEDDKKKITDKCDDAIKWLDANQLAEVEEFQEKQKEVEAVCNPHHHQAVPECRRSKCPTWEVCQEVACQVQEAPLQEVDLDPDQPSRRSTKLCPLPTSHIKIVFETYVILLQPAFLFSISVRK